MSGIIRAYQRVISPLLPPSCRFGPTCSEYGLQSISRFGPFKGGWLTLRRILSCHPFGQHGYDPVPEVWPGLLASIDRSQPIPPPPEEVPPT